MKAKLILVSIIFFFNGLFINAQLLEKLKERAKEKGLETQEVSYDSTTYDASKDHSDEKGFKLESANDFFTNDVVMDLYNNDGQLVQTSFFDAETIAMRTQQVSLKDPIYHDNKGYIYAFDDQTNSYKKVNLLPGSSMGFMTAGMTTQVYKLPQEPYFEAYEVLLEKDIALNFLVLEMAFIYKPQHFESVDNYRLQNVPCFPNVCKRFIYNDPEYEGSYIQFDDKDRLTEFYINSTKAEFNDSKNPSGRFVYRYEQCDVKLPDAEEQSMIPGPLGKMLNLERGLEPWKYNKNDKQKNN